MLKQCQKKFEFLIKNPEVADKKLIASFLLMFFLWLIKNPTILFLLDGLLLLFLLMSGISWKWFKKILLIAVISSFMPFLAQMITGNFIRGKILLLQITFIIFWSGFMMTTTREMDFIYALQKVLSYFRISSVKIEKISLIFFLTLRSIAIISEQYRQIRIAQKARGLEKHFLAIIMPLLIKMFKAAHSMTEALIARGGG